MEQNLIVSKSIDIHANVAKVWDALTKPEIIKDYLFGTETITDWKVGSEIIFQGVYDGEEYQDKGTICENIPHELISYTYWSGFSGHEDIPENYTFVTYNLKKIDKDNTNLMWTQKGFPSEKACKQSGYTTESILSTIKRVIESKQGNNPQTNSQQSNNQQSNHQQSNHYQKKSLQSSSNQKQSNQNQTIQNQTNQNQSSQNKPYSNKVNHNRAVKK